MPSRCSKAGVEIVVEFYYYISRRGIYLLTWFEARVSKLLKTSGNGVLWNHQLALEIQHHQFKDLSHIVSSCWYLPGSFSYCLIFIWSLLCTTFLHFYWERRICKNNIIPLYFKIDCFPFLLQQIIFEIENLFLGIDITSSGRQPWADFVLDLREQIQTYETNRG